MSSITVTPLGAGQDVGRSCLLVCIGGKRIMLDCGMYFVIKYANFVYIIYTLTFSLNRPTFLVYIPSSIKAILFIFDI